jgi:hypothetical protein
MHPVPLPATGYSNQMIADKVVKSIIYTYFKQFFTLNTCF